VTSRRSAWTWSSYFPHGLLEPRKRGEQALLSVVQQAYVCGVSTRRVDQLVESLGLRISRSEVSRVCALLDEQVEAFRCRPLEGRLPLPDERERELLHHLPGLDSRSCCQRLR
jgi:Transposase, Mutator family